MNMTARFKYESYVIEEVQKTDFTGIHTSRRIIYPLKEIDFEIARYVECKYHYNIIVYEKDANVMDGGETLTIINVPKDMITIANKENNT